MIGKLRLTAGTVFCKKFQVDVKRQICIEDTYMYIIEILDYLPLEELFYRMEPLVRFT